LFHDLLKRCNKQCKVSTIRKIAKNHGHSKKTFFGKEINKKSLK